MLANLNEVLKDAQTRHYGIGLFNFFDTDLLEATISAAEELRSPVIIGTAEVLLKYGELKLMAPAMIEAARRATVPVVVHYDHGLTFDRCMEAIHCGFTSVMFDGSAGDVDQNIAETRAIVRVAHSLGVTVEGEIGHVGETINNDGMTSDLYTTPDEAESYIRDTGVDALAIAIGTAHGTYRQKPKLDLNRLREIRARVDTPLVLHGGSGLSDDDFRNTVRDGITKINIFTDLQNAGEAAMRQGLDQHLCYADIRALKVEMAKEAVMSKMRLFGSEGKA